MLNAVFENDLLPSMFRSLSRGKRQGVLKISDDAGTYALNFHNGKIVSVDPLDGNISRSIAGRLLRAEVINEDQYHELRDVDLTVSQLHVALTGNYGVDDELFLRAKRSAELDMLHDFRLSEGLAFDFKPMVQRVDEKLSLNAYPGHILLNMVALDADVTRFSNVFGVNPASAIVTIADETNDERMTWNEQIVWQILSEESCLSAVFAKSLLSEFDVKNALLSLRDRGRIQIDRLNGESLIEKEDSPLFPSGMVPDATSANEQYQHMKEEASPEPASDSMVLHLAETDVQISLHSDDSREEESPTSKYQAPKLEEFAEDKVCSAVDVEIPTKKLQQSEVLKGESKKREETMSGRIIRHENMPLTSAISTLPFLVAIAFILPDLVRDLFLALREFSSALL